MIELPCSAFESPRAATSTARKINRFATDYEDNEPSSSAQRTFESRNHTGKKKVKGKKESQPNDFFLEALSGSVSVEAPNTSGKKRKGGKNSPMQSLHESLQAIKLANIDASRSFSSVNSSQYEDVDVVRIEVEQSIAEN